MIVAFCGHSEIYYTGGIPEWLDIIFPPDVVVSSITHNWGGAAKTLAYAKQKYKAILQHPELSISKAP